MQLQHVLVSALLLCLPGTVHSLYEEQAGQYDWHLRLLGRASKAVFAPRGRPRVYVATEEGVLASLNARDGSIVWRQVLPEGDSLLQLAVSPKPAAVVTLSAQGWCDTPFHAALRLVCMVLALMRGPAGGSERGAQPMGRCSGSALILKRSQAQLWHWRSCLSRRAKLAAASPCSWAPSCRSLAQLALAPDRHLQAL